MSLNGPERAGGVRKSEEEVQRREKNSTGHSDREFASSRSKSKDERRADMVHLAPPNSVPDRVAATPGTTFSPGEFVFWIEGGVTPNEDADGGDSNSSVAERAPGDAFASSSSTKSSSAASAWEAKEAEPGFSSQAFFRAHMDGVYTACRTMERWSIVDYDTHLDRLVSIMTLEPSKSGSRLKLTRPIMAAVLTPVLQKLIQRFCEHDRNSMAELRLTMLVSHAFQKENDTETLSSSSSSGSSTISDPPNVHSSHPPPHHTSSTASSFHSWGKGLWQSQTKSAGSNLSITSDLHSLQASFYDLYQLWVFGEYMPEIPAPPIIVDLIHAERHNPTVKHVDWTTERKALSKQGTEGANEMIMMDGETKIYEGLSSNFMAVYRDGTVYTAPDNTVLSGTIRNLMLRCAKEIGVVVKMECPRFDQIEQWTAACVMSTSRLLLPIHKINFLQPIKDEEEKDVDRGQLERTDLSAPSASVPAPQHRVPIISTFATPATPMAPHALAQNHPTRIENGGKGDFVEDPLRRHSPSPSPSQETGLSGSSSPQHPASPQPSQQHQHEHQHIPSIVRSDSSCSLTSSSASLGSTTSSATNLTTSSHDTASSKILPHYVASQHEFLDDNEIVSKLMAAITHKMRLSSTSIQLN